MLDNVSSGLLAKLALDVTDLKCDFIAINWFFAMMKQIVQDFSENGYEVAGLEQPINISDDEKLGQVFEQSEFQNMYIDIGGGDHHHHDDDSVEATLGLSL